MRRLHFEFSIIIFSFLVSSSFGYFETPAATNNGTYTTTTLSPERQLVSAFRIAKGGNFDRGLAIAKSTLQTFPEDIATKLTFIETMVRMQKLGTKKHEVRIINCAIKTANQVYRLDCCGGDQDPANSFKYMRVLTQLAEVVYPKRREVSIQLKAVAGDIANNLYDNTGVSEKSHKYLAKPLYEKARLHLLNQERTLAAETLSTSFQVGFSNFEQAKRDFSYEFLAAKDIIRTTIENAVDSFVDGELREARKAFSEFNSFPLTIDAEGLKNGRINSADFVGKPLIVDLWATWCPPCRKSIPHFVRLTNEYEGKNLNVLAISLDDMDNPLGTREAVMAAANKYKFNYPCGLGNYSIVNQIGGELQLPTTLFIDAAGNVRYLSQGYMEYTKLNVLTKALLELDK